MSAIKQMLNIKQSLSCLFICRPPFVPIRTDSPQVEFNTEAWLARGISFPEPLIYSTDHLYTEAKVQPRLTAHPWWWALPQRLNYKYSATSVVS